MNKVILMGRLTRDPESRVAQGNEDMTIVRFSVAINRRFSKDNQADFINCVAFGKTGEFISKYFTKGQMIAVVGRLQVNNYTDKDGNKRTSTDVVVEEANFTGGKSEGGSSTGNVSIDSASPDGFYSQSEEVVDDDLPF